MSRYDDDIDEVDETSEVSTPAPASAARQIKRGWGAADKVKTADSKFAQRLKVGEDPTIIKFLEDEPYASFRQHWVERQGQKSFTCIADLDPKGCPLCDAGNRPATRFAFNVVLLEPDTEPMVKSYEVGPRAIDQLKNFHTDPRQGPLSKHYWAVSRTGKGTTSLTNHQLVKERDLADEWDGIDPLTEVDLKNMSREAYTPEIIQIPERKVLQSVVIEDLDD